MKIKTLSLAILIGAFCTPLVFANLPCSSGGCESSDPCECKGEGPGGGGSGGGNGGNGGGNSSSSVGSGTGLGAGTGNARAASIAMSVNFGQPANENINIGAKFSLYSKEPTPLLYSPQMLQYQNHLLDKISYTEINARNTSQTGSASTGDTGGFGVVKYVNDMPANVDRRVKIFTEKREQLTFEFSKDDPVGNLTGNHVNMNYKLKMVNSSGVPTIENPQYYDYYLDGGRFVRYSIANGDVVFYSTPSGRVIYPSSPSVGLEAIRDEEGIIRQVYSLRDGLADVVIPDNMNGYEIRFYLHANIGNKVDGIYTVSGSPHTVWRVENPNPGTNTRVKITKTANNTTEVYNFEYSHNSGGWMLHYPDQLAVTSQSSSWDYSKTVRTLVSVDRTLTGTVARKISNVYQKFPFGDRLVSSTLDPDGANRKTIYTYHTSGTGSYARIATQRNPDGSWTTYQYDQHGRTVQQVSPWKNTAFNTTPENARTLYTSYQPHDERDTVQVEDVRPRTVEEKILGITTKKTFYAYYFDNNCYVDVKEECVNPSARYGDSSNLRTVWRYYPKGDSNSPSAARLHTVTYPNGTMDTYTYEYGNWASNANPAQSSFTPGNGSAVRMTVIHGTAASPAGIPYKSTSDTAIYDSRGNLVYTTLNVYTGSAHETVSWVSNTYDAERRLLSEHKSNGELTEYTWNCCNKESETLPDGTQHTYTYDAMKRLVSKTKVGIGDQPDLITTYEYDAVGNETKRTTSGGDLSLTATAEYNLAGQITKEINEQGLITTYSYINGTDSGSNLRGQTVTVTNPGGATTVQETFTDGQMASVTGTAQVSQYYDYGVNNDGSTWVINRIGGGDSPGYAKITSDMLFRTVKEEKPAFSEGIITKNNFYNTKNQLVKFTETGKPDTLFIYDELDNLIRSGADLNQNGSLDLDSDDRITDINTIYQKDNLSWWLIQTQSTYAVSGNNIPVTVANAKKRISGFNGNIVSEEQSMDIHGNITVYTAEMNRASKQQIIETIYPDSTISEKRIMLNGLLISTRSQSNLTTTFGYDALGRRITNTDPRIGTINYAYHTATGKIGQLQSVTDPAGNTTSYDYDSVSGRLLWEKNALNHYTRYAYNDRGQTIQVWGDSPYPVMFAYNQFGEQTQMWTFRANADWNNQTWPQSIIGDQTTWNYDPATGLLLSKTDAAGKSVTYHYGPDGKLTKRTWARGLFTDYQYDTFGQITKIDYSDDTPDITYAYNRIGQLTSVQGAAGTRIFGYNETLDLISETINGIYNKTITRTYTTTGAKGKVLSMAVDGANNYTYGYDQYGRLNKITTSAGDFNYSYLANSDLISQMNRPNGVNTTWSYEPNRNLVTQVQNGTISTFGYTNDAIGRRTAMSRSGSAFTAPDTLNYTYDTRSQVTGANSNVNNNYNFSYNYDPIGNRLASNNTEYTTNTLNQYTQITSQLPNFSTSQFTYDDDGNMLTNNGWTYTWNAENRLIKAEKDSQKLEFAYDYMGRRIEKKVFEGETITKHIRFIYDNYKLIEEINALNENAITKRYTWQPEEARLDIPLQVNDIAANQTYYYLTDANKNVSQLTDTPGNTIAHYEYDLFGKQTKTTGSYSQINPFRFSSEYYDNETELVYYNYRYYAFDLGRWFSLDPIEEDNNLYLFINNSTLNYWDYLGLAKTFKNPAKINCVGYAAGANAHVQPGKGQSQESMMKDLGFSCVPKSDRCIPKDECEEAFILYIYSYNYNPEKKDPYRDPFVYGGKNDSHAVKMHSDGSATEISGSHFKGTPRANPTSCDVNSWNKSVPKNRQYCCKKKKQIPECKCKDKKNDKK